jgi:DNA-binding beta-propeller fold protein YncE
MRVERILMAGAAAAIAAGAGGGGSAHAALPASGLTSASCIQNTGGSACPATAPALDGANGIAISPDGANVYAAGTVSDAIAIFSRNPDGSLTPAGCIEATGSSLGCGASVEGLLGPRGLVVSPDGQNVYVTAHDTSPSSDRFITLDRGAGGTLSDGGSCMRGAGGGPGSCSLGTAGFDDLDGVAIRPDGGTLYAANDASPGGITVFTRGAGGNLTAYNGTASAGFLTRPLRVAVSPGGGTLYTAGTVSDNVAWFPLKADGTLDLANGKCVIKPPGGGGCVASAAGLDGARGVAASPDGASVYVASTVDDAVVRFDVGAGGALTPAGCVKDPGSAAACAATAPGLDGAAEVAVSPDGQNVYVASQGPGNAVVAFARGPGGALAPVNCVQNTGGSACGATAAGLNSPQSLAAGPDGRSVYTAAFVSDAVTWLLGDAGTAGGVTPVPGTLPAAGPGALPPKPVLGALAVVPARFRIGPLMPKVLASRRVPTGATIRFRLSRAASVAMTFERARPGRRVGRACRRPTRANRRRPRCTRWVRAGTLVRAARAGLVRVRFQGRLRRRRAFAPGRYRLTAIPSTKAAGAGTSQRVRFTLLPALRRR